MGAVTTAALDAALAGKADSALAALLSTVDGLDTPLEVDTKIANALLGLATEAFVAAQLASRDASISALQGAKADATLLALYATNAALSASKTTLQSALDAILAAQLSGGGGVVNAPAWAGFTTWELVRGSSVVRNLHLEDPLSAALANGDDTLSITADCYSVAAADAALAAALLAYYTSAQVDALLVDYRTGAAQDAETTGAISAALLAYYTSAQTRTFSRPTKSPRRWWRTARPPTRTRRRPRGQDQSWGGWMPQGHMEAFRSSPFSYLRLFFFLLGRTSPGEAGCRRRSTASFFFSRRVFLCQEWDGCGAGASCFRRVLFLF